MPAKSAFEKLFRQKSPENNAERLGDLGGKPPSCIGGDLRPYSGIL
jgi:hypothetical protein